jgi:hypothetical protein
MPDENGLYQIGPFRNGPCTKVMDYKTCALLGVVMPRKVQVKCPFCDHKCEWFNRMVREAREELDAIHELRERLEGWNR